MVLLLYVYIYLALTKTKNKGSIEQTKMTRYCVHRKKKEEKEKQWNDWISNGQTTLFPAVCCLRVWRLLHSLPKWCYLGCGTDWRVCECLVTALRMLHAKYALWACAHVEIASCAGHGNGLQGLCCKQLKTGLELGCASAQFPAQFGVIMACLLCSLKWRTN